LTAKPTSCQHSPFTAVLQTKPLLFISKTNSLTIDASKIHHKQWNGQYMSVQVIMYAPSKHPPEGSLDWDHTDPPVCREEAEVVVLLWS
jgi:hypothetical protein